MTVVAYKLHEVFIEYFCFRSSLESSSMLSVVLIFERCTFSEGLCHRTKMPSCRQMCPPKNVQFGWDTDSPVVIWVLKLDEQMVYADIQLPVQISFQIIFTVVGGKACSKYIYCSISFHITTVMCSTCAQPMTVFMLLPHRRDRTRLFNVRTRWTLNTCIFDNRAPTTLTISFWISFHRHCNNSSCHQSLWQLAL